VHFAEEWNELHHLQVSNQLCASALLNQRCFASGMLRKVHFAEECTGLHHLQVRAAFIDSSDGVLEGDIGPALSSWPCPALRSWLLRF
jgi:hypothetical protein